ncbi:hypothetical protein [Streptomyces shenzhenensis]
MKYMLDACDRPSLVPLGECRSTFPKYTSVGFMAHKGRPNQVLI